MRNRQPSLRTRLSQLVAVVLLPLMLLVIGLAVVNYRADRERAVQQARAVARGIALAVEAELHARIAAMEILAASPYLAAGDLTAFRAQASAVLAREEPGSNITLLREDGQQVMNLYAPPEAPLPARQTLDNLRRVFTTGRPLVSDEFLDVIMKRPVVAVDVPVRRADGSVSMALAFNPSLSLFDAAIRRQDPPPGWVVSVFDRKGVNVARTPNPERFAGKPASPTLLPLLLASDDGMAETISLEGTPLLTAWSRPGPSGWSVAVGAPCAVFYAPLWRTLGVTLVSFGLMLAAALMLAARLASRIERPIRALADLGAIERIGKGNVASLGLQEADATATLLVAAMRERAEAEAARAARDADFLEAQRVAHIGSWRWDAATDVTTGSDEMLRIFGLDPEIESMPLFSEQRERLYPIASWERINQAIGPALETGTEYQFDVEAFRGETPIWVAMHGEALRNADGRVVGLRGTGQDVTARKRAELGLADSEARFRALATATQEGVVIHDEQHIVEANEAYWRMFGYASYEDVVGRSPFELFVPAARADARSKVSSQHADPYETLGLRRDGSTFPIETHAHTILYQGCRMRVGVIRDLTRQKAAEAALERLAVMAERVRDPVLLLARDGRILEANAAAAAAYGHDHSTLLGLSIRDLRASETQEDTTDQMARADQGGVLFETRHRHADGSLFPVEVSSIGAEVSGQRVLVSVIRDITVRKQAEAALAESEARLSLALKGAQVGLHEVDLARGIYRIDAAFAQMAEIPAPEIWRPLDDEFWREWLARIHPEDAPLRSAYVDRLCLGDDSEPELDFRLSHRDGSQVWLRQRFIITERDPVSGEARRLLGLMRDVTQARDGQAALERLVEERTRELRETQARLAHTERMQALGQLAGGIAHDINNVLQAVQGGSALLGRRCGDPNEVRRLAALILKAAERGTGVTSRLLAFSRRSDLQGEPIDVPLLLHGMKDMLAHTLGTGIEVRIMAPDDLPPLVADKAQLETALVNLATNARDAMDGMGTLTLTAAEDVRRHAMRFGSHLMLEPGRYIHLSVTDTGCGMDAAMQARVTEPFFTTKPQGKGTGLGLAMARGFSEQSGDGIHIESAPGKGTTVRLYFPAAAKAASSPTRDAGALRPSLDGRNVRLLLVDDDPMVRDVVEAEMQEAGLVVSACESGPEALAHLDRGEAVDVLVSDLSMPVMDGLTLIREAKRRRPSLPAILLTGFSTNVADITVGDDLDGSFLLLRKPISGNAIVERVASLLEGTYLSPPPEREANEVVANP